MFVFNEVVEVFVGDFESVVHKSTCVMLIYNSNVSFTAITLKALSA